MRNIAVSIVIIFNCDFDMLKKTLPQNIQTLAGTGEIPFEVILVADGSSQESLSELLPWFYDMPIDELRVRRRDRHRFLVNLDSDNFIENSIPEMMRWIR